MMFEKIQWSAVFLAIASIGGVLIYKPEISPTAVIVTGIVGLLFLLLLNVGSLKSFTLGKEGVRAELEVLQKKTSENDAAITNLILLSMGTDAYSNLQKLATGAYGPYKKEHYMGLETELYHLRNLGYIALKDKTARSIYDIPGSGDQLSDYIEVTDQGKKYLELREKYTPKG